MYVYIYVYSQFSDHFERVTQTIATKVLTCKSKKKYSKINETQPKKIHGKYKDERENKCITKKKKESDPFSIFFSFLHPQ